MKRLSKSAAKRLAVVIVLLPVAGWAAFICNMAYFQSVVIPESAEFLEVRAFVLASQDVAGEFGALRSATCGDRHRVQGIGTDKRGFFSVAVIGDRARGVVDVDWRSRKTGGGVEVLVIRKHVPWGNSSVLYKKRPNQISEVSEQAEK